MIDLPNLFSAFYQRLVLRDLFGKIVPGAIFLAFTVVAFWPSQLVVARVSSLNLVLTLLGLGLAWLVAFVLQALGESVHILRNSPKGQTRADFYRQMARFDGGATDLQRMHAERLLVIKEACGNGGMALLLGVLVNLIVTGTRCTFSSTPCADGFAFPWLPVAVLSVVSGVLLARWHREHVERHRDFIERFLELNAAPK